MKTKIILGLLAIVLAAALIGGATGAWFTDKADLDAVTFTAGTVIVNVGEEPQVIPMEGKSIDNVNPGDCAGVCWDIQYEGTKDAELIVKLYKKWLSADEESLPTDNVYYVLQPGSGWTMYKGGEDDGGDYILFHRSVEGSFENEDFDGDVKLCLAILFYGPDTGNEYQGATFTLEGKVEAVQASNGAPEAYWGEDWFTSLVPHYDYSYLFENSECYYGNGNGNGEYVCWGKETAWGEGERFVPPPGNWAMYFTYDAQNGGVQTVNLIAGQNYNAGTITVSKDANNLYLEFNTTGNWKIMKLDIHAAGSLAGIPVNSQGIPVPGSFDYKYENLGNVTTYNVTIPLSAIGEHDIYYIAAHAEVQQCQVSEEMAY